MENAVMKALAITGMAGLLVIVAVHGQRNAIASRTGAKAEGVVDAMGNLRVPDAYRTTYQLLGSWAVAASQGQGSKELHVVYASPGTITAYREDGHFPDGAVLVIEVAQAATAQASAASDSHDEALKGSVVMVKDRNGRYVGKKLWGDGEGWSKFDADNPSKTTSTDYKWNWRSCHVPAQASDWVYVGGYPPLKR